MNKCIILHLNKMDANDQSVNEYIINNLSSGNEFAPLKGKNEKIFDDLIANVDDAFYLFIHYIDALDFKTWQLTKIDHISICSYKKIDGEVYVKLICELYSKPYIEYIFDETRISIEKDFDRYGDYFKLINSKEIYRRLSLFFEYNNPYEKGVKRLYNLNYIDDELHDTKSICFTKSFRRLQDKTQIFSTSKGDHYRTRLTHTNDVVIISQYIAEKINKKLLDSNNDKKILIDINTVNAIAYGHDIGHTPFGHQGERTLNNIINGNNKNIIKNASDKLALEIGGFKHNIQSVRVLSKLENEDISYSGLNIKYEVLEGILKHTEYSVNDVICLIDKNIVNHLHIKFFINGNKSDDADKCLYDNYYISGQIVRIADTIAQRGSDIEDAVKAGKIVLDELINNINISKYKDFADELKEIFNQIGLDNNINSGNIIVEQFINKIIMFLVDDIVRDENINNIINNIQFNLWFSQDVNRFNDIIDGIIHDKVVSSREVIKFDYYSDMVISKLFEVYYKNPRLLNDNFINRIYVDMLSNNFLNHYSIDFRNMNKKICDNVMAEINKLTINDIDIVNSLSEDIKKDIYNLLPEEFDKKYPENIIEIKRKKISFEQQRVIIRAICDYICGMTDTYALNEYNQYL